MKAIRPFNRQMSDLADFFVAAGQDDGVAPATGGHTLADYYQELASQWLEKAWEGVEYHIFLAWVLTFYL